MIEVLISVSDSIYYLYIKNLGFRYLKRKKKRREFTSSPTKGRCIRDPLSSRCNKISIRLICNCPCKHCFACSRRSVEHHSFWSINTRSIKKFRVLQRKLYHVSDFCNRIPESTQVLKHDSWDALFWSRFHCFRKNLHFSRVRNFTIPELVVETTCRLISPSPKEGNYCPKKSCKKSANMDPL